MQFLCHFVDALAVKTFIYQIKSHQRIYIMKYTQKTNIILVILFLRNRINKNKWSILVSFFNKMIYFTIYPDQ